MLNATSLLTGYLLNVGLFGALTVQVYHYIVHYPQDKWSIKSVVHGIYFCECAQTALSLCGLYGMITQRSVRWNFQDLIIALFLVIFSIIVRVITQSFYAYRVYLLSHKAWITTTIVITSFVQLVLLCVILVESILSLNSTGSLPVGISTPVTCLFTVTGICDVIIAAAMIFFLSRSNTDLASTNRLLKKVIRNTVETGAVTAVGALACLVLFVAFPNRLYVVAIAFPLVKLYSTGLLAQLNGRREAAEPSEETVEFAFLESDGTLDRKESDGLGQETLGTGATVRPTSGDVQSESLRIAVR